MGPLAIAPPRAILVVVLGAYLFGSLAGLGVYPRVGEDEPWIAAGPYKLASEGVLGSDLFTGLAGMERHHYQHMPVYPVLEALVFKIFGTGVVQMRLLSVGFGFLLLITVFMVGRLIADEGVGVMAVLMLVLLRIADGGDATGILLLDRARVNRYDIAVPVFGLLAFYAFVRAERNQRSRAYFTAGLLSGLSSLSHLYGAFWLVVLAGLLVARAGPRAVAQRPAWLMALGFFVAWSPWGAFISTGWTDYLGQMRTVADRFEIFSPAFYVTNALDGEGPISARWLIDTVRSLPAGRIGAWTALVGLPAAVAIMAWQARLPTPPAEAARSDAIVASARLREPAIMLAVVAVAQLVLFAAMLRMKTLNYMIALWPIGILCLAWLAAWSWRRGRRAVRAALVLLAAAIAFEGGTRIAHARAVASRTTSYDWYTADVARCIPPGSLVLGMQHYWLGLRQFPYRTWLLPLMQTNPRFTDGPVAFDAALEAIDPDVVLIDRYIAEMFELTANPDDPLHRLWVDFGAFAARRRLVPACVVRDRTYGVMEVYHVPKVRSPAAGGPEGTGR